VIDRIIAFSLSLLLCAPLNAEDWVRGSLYLHEVDGEITLAELGEDPFVVGMAQAPLATSGLVNCSAAYGSSAFFSTSNRSWIYFEGSGSFAVERFEQIAPDAAAWAAEPEETEQSRMIINFRSGTLIMDSRNMAESSQSLIETPLGRITVKRALWQMNIVFDPRSQIFDFTITCSSGRVRFTDLSGQQYTLRNGQRLAGAGSRTQPSIEVGEKTERSDEQMERFRILSEAHAEASDDLELYLGRMQAISQAAAQAPTTRSLQTRESKRRPIVIEYAKEPEAVTPFRGEIKPPSDWQADLF